ncbi:MAG: glycoside hydrolase family 2 TIM barrel-domain containing protein [Bacteroidota bacterium]
MMGRNQILLMSMFLPTCMISCISGKQDPASLLPEVLDKPVEKVTISLNSEDDSSWTLCYGLQDEKAPRSPRELKRSDFSSIPATVPGNVEIDLQRAGVIDDPMIGDNVYDLRRYESFQWWYHRSFGKPDVAKGERIELSLEGIDCIADVWLNGVKIARVENMFVEHHFDVTDLVREKNQLYICIHSTVLEARKHIRNNFGVRYDALAEAVSVRKAPHMFGWDIMPRLVSAGIWREVNLEIIPPSHWESVYWVTKKVDVNQREASMYVDWQFATDRLNIDDLTMEIKLERDGMVAFEKSVKVYTTVSRERIEGLENMDFWWPRGFGEPALYTATLKLMDGDALLCENRQQIGIRTVELVRTEVNTQEDPGEFVFVVNGEKVFVKGTNWVPLDALHSRDKQHVQGAVDMLADLNCNMVRLWGGNVYESDVFYDLCDRNGIMVWQDFTMGCTTYPQSREFAEKVRVEAGKAIRRLRNHPSIVLWAGNNENDVSLNWSDDQSHLDPNTDVISRQVLPLAVREYDPKTHFLPSSPFISSELFSLHKRIDPDASPEMHLWGPRGYYKAPFYTANRAKFVSEIGYHGCPSRKSLEKMMEPGFVYPWKEGFQWNRQWQAKAVMSHPNAETSRDRNNLMINQVKILFGVVPTDLDTFIFASQVVQAEAMKYFVEFWRMNKFDRNGILWWNLRDGWPIISDAIVDYYGRKKLAYHYIKKVQKDVCVMIGDEGLVKDAPGAGHPIVVVNDTREAVSGRMTVRDADTGQVVFRKSFHTEENGKSVEGYLPDPGKTTLWLIEWEVNEEVHTNHYLAYEPVIDLKKYMDWSQLLK